MTDAPAAKRQSSFDQEAIQKLERQLQQRPEKSELKDKNILKDDRVAPALQAAKEQLARSQLQDKIGQAIGNRPKPEELVKEGILQPEEVPSA